MNILDIETFLEVNDVVTPQFNRIIYHSGFSEYFSFKTSYWIFLEELHLLRKSFILDGILH